MKKALSVLLVALLLTSTFLFAVPASAATTYKTGDHIQFGTYPQTRVEETTALKNAANAATWKSYNYYTGTGVWNDGNMTPGDYMRYADFFCDSTKYRAVTFSAYRPYATCDQSTASNTYQDENGYVPNKIYYFKYEPLTWRVLDPTTGYIMCERLIDAQAYQNVVYDIDSYEGPNKTQTAFANDYVTSPIRHWLNNDFYETAFTASQKEDIKTTALNNNAIGPEYAFFNSAATNDKIFLPSYADVLNTSFGFSSTYNIDDKARMAKGTDYAKCQGLWVVGSSSTTLENSWWWLRTPHGEYFEAGFVSDDGFVDPSFGFYVGYTGGGIRPACCLKSITSNIPLSTPTNSLYDPSTLVLLGYDDGALRPGTELSVHELLETADYADTAFGRIVGWDVHLVIGPDTTQPLKAVTLKLPIPAGFDKSRIAVYHETDSKTHATEKVKDVTVDGDYAVVSASSFSVYLLVEENDPNACPYCGKVHKGFFQKIVGFFHKILFRLFGAKKK